ncbi:PREDICTED: sodium/potassium-transporting ATPase subunit alpha-like [Wasmannia auropunctata]|uniref:sodium/potassium-transporting ATPase subunit alpha-like n=1 Tax=Wasmannia auropunctata TaxID=64793 RepID=UPI0005EFEC7D|nr:PREDICTED: sodium/potassium-transporting ATPase subunit alpha-like [Wasmannia auropunctata]XP_011707518.1 PREDICTED: sodium/potassium-transporting ATPase subunit alpha-like [Wasmannia auropunctata]
MMQQPSRVRASSMPHEPTRASIVHLHKKKLTEQEIQELHQELETVDHVIALESLYERLGTNAKTGLTNEQARKIMQRDGPNALTPPRLTPEYIKFLKCMFHGFASLLWVCAILCFVLYGVTLLMHEEDIGIAWLGIIIVTICITSGVFAYIQESKNIKVMESFKKMVPTFATVIRDGVKLRMSTEELVLGDLVEIRMGDKIPADIRIIECRGLRVENSSITGESEPVARTNYPTDRNPLESANVAFSTSFAVAGDGRGIVIATGDHTMIGRLAGLTSHLAKIETPIAKEIRHFVEIITIVAVICGLAFFGLSLLLEPNIVRAFTYLLGIVIANVPEVLLVTVTTVLTLTAQKMASKNCLVKNLEAVETLGSTSAICSDKTGTLTQNKMSVSNLWFGHTRYNFPPGQRIGVERDLLLEKPAFGAMLRAATLCLRAEFTAESFMLAPIEEREIIGDASETGILKFCEHIHPTQRYRVEAHPKVAEIPFSSTTKYQMSIHRDHAYGYTMILKGAPEVILENCTTILTADGETREMTAHDHAISRRACTELGYLGERVLAYCDLHLPARTYGPDYKFDTDSPASYNFPVKGYRFVGLISLQDPPRPGVPEAVHKCRTAGIKVIMVTGDHPVTAMAVAKKVGIISEGHEIHYERSILQSRSYSQTSALDPAVVDVAGAIVITGAELRSMDANELDKIIRRYEEIVFARTSPQQKLLIVESCQRLGEIVAVTGDGVNDSPALRQADIGVAMGIAGSDVAKNAADMILMDDNFASIVTGVEEGRLIFDNLKKSIAYTLTSSVPEMLPMLSGLLFAIPLPLVIELVICIDVGTDVIPAIALAYERPESDIMRRAPRNPQYDKLVNKRLISITYGQIGMTQSLAGFYTYFMILMMNGFMPDRLLGLRIEWENPSINDLQDSWGQTWTYENRMNLLMEAQSGYFLSIVITQMIDLVMCKTRRNSIFQQGMTNWHGIRIAYYAIDGLLVLALLAARRLSLDLRRIETFVHSSLSRWHYGKRNVLLKQTFLSFPFLRAYTYVYTTPM